MPALQYKYFILTIPYEDWQVPQQLPEGVAYLYGQAEEGETGYKHWQFLAYFARKVTCTKAKTLFPVSAHIEPTRSSFAESYVRKEETKIPGSEFELGRKAFKRNSDTDWNDVWENAKKGKMEEIPADVRVRCYNTLTKIQKDYQQPVLRDIQQVNVYWGVTGSGKTHRVFEEIGSSFYIKSSTTKWFDGYNGQEDIVIDEFSGVIDIVHLLKWLDRYPCAVEVKGSQVYLNTKRWWITSNINPQDWYNKEGVTSEQRAALRRRLTNVVHFNNAYQEIRAAHVAANCVNDIDAFISSLFE